MCDTRAKEVGEQLYSLIKGRLGAPHSQSVRLFVAPKIRAVHDYNRDSSLHTPFRQQIRDWVERQDRCIIYEMHSFPPDTRLMGGNQMVILNIRQGAAAGCTLLDALKPLQLKIAHIEGSQVNSLQREFMSRSDVTHYLLEFNEDYLELTKKEEGIILKALADFATTRTQFVSWRCAVSSRQIAIVLILLLLLGSLLSLGGMPRHISPFSAYTSKLPHAMPRPGRPRIL